MKRIMTDATVIPNPPLAANSARSFNSLGSMTCIVVFLSVEEKAVYSW
jgi:hypothetical protein